jgi:Zn-dependent peptidase ImmA (M78 family)
VVSLRGTTLVGELRFFDDVGCRSMMANNNELPLTIVTRTMNTTEFGDVLEKQVHDYLSELIAADLYWVRKENCKIFWKKGYYSAQRRSKIIFDVAIEVWMPGASKYSLLILVECKRYTTKSVPVGDIEEFFQKVQQVSSGNRKAILASNAAFESGTRSFAESNGVGLLRYLDASNAKWELYRSPSIGARSASKVDIESIDEALSLPEYTRHVMDLYMQSSGLLTNSFWDFTEDLIRNSGLSLVKIRAFQNPRGKPKNQIPFIDNRNLEEKALDVLHAIGHKEEKVSLAQICALEEKRAGLRVYQNVRHFDDQTGISVLGKISFTPLEITIFEQKESVPGRDRFTLAHELAHYFLGHSKYIAGEYCDDSDFALLRPNGHLGPEIARIEYQANYFASCLLMPTENFVGDFRRIAQNLGINDKGFGALYVDNQPCNNENFYRATGVLMKIYEVSRAAVSIRLETLGLLRDVRSTGPFHVSAALASPLSFLSLQ